MNKLIINTDGASRGNPGPAAAGFIIKDEKGQKLDSGSCFLGPTTNNEAEYRAVILALEKLLKDHQVKLPARILIKADSLLMVNQLSGRFKIKNSNIKLLIDEIKNLEKKIGDVVYAYIPRAENKSADTLVNQTLDAHLY